MFNHFMKESEKDVFFEKVALDYIEFRNNHEWYEVKGYRKGVMDFCDFVIFASSRLTYDFSSLRNEIEEIFDDIDDAEKEE